MPTTVGALPDVEAGVTGLTAQWKDSTDEITSKLPLVVAFVLVLAFALMLVAFRSPVIAAKAIVLNLLSVAAAYGVLVLVFQHGVGKGLLGFSSTAGIDPVVPLLLFVILFGLSMDYHVFLLSRIRELVQRGASTDEAVTQGIKSTAGVVTSAAIVMVAVFAVFITLSMLFFKQFGVGLAAAILLDATIVRGVLLPASMKLLGDWNWYLPSWLESSTTSSSAWAARASSSSPGAGTRASARSTACARRSSEAGRCRSSSRSTRTRAWPRPTRPAPPTSPSGSCAATPVASLRSGRGSPGSPVRSRARTSPPCPLSAPTSGSSTPSARTRPGTCSCGGSSASRRRPCSPPTGPS